MGGKLDDAERRRRLEAVLHILSQDPGRVSPEGLDRLARRLGMDMYSESSDKDRLMTLASGAYAIDVSHTHQTKRLQVLTHRQVTFHRDSPVVQDVALQFHGLADSVSETAPSAAGILFRDLQGVNGLPTINIKLNRFADNLARLARLDKLSVTGANCFEAVAGIAASLERLFQHEKDALRASRAGSTEISDEQLNIEVMATKSGRPLMHVRCRVGLSLEYWKEQRQRSHDRSPLSGKVEPGDMETDHAQPKDGHDDDEDVFSLTIECEHCPQSLFQSIRVTDDWLSPQVVKQPGTTEADEAGLEQDVLDWTEPPQPLLAPAEADTMAPNSTAPPTQTQARFVARVEPPVVLPFNVSAQVLASVGVDISQEMGHMQAQHQTFDGLLLGRERPSSTRLSIPTINGTPQASAETWDVRMSVTRPEYGRSLDSIPFAHPRQLLPILPVLRQYILLNSLLRSLVNVSGASAKGYGALAHSHPLEASTRDASDEVGGAQDVVDTYSRAMEVTFQQATPVPRLAVTMLSSNGPCSLTVDVLLNGEIELGLLQEVSGMKEEMIAILSAKKTQLTKALAICENLPMWAEWVLSTIVPNEA